MAGVRKTIFPKAQLWKNDFSLKCSTSSSGWCSRNTYWIQVSVQISQFIQIAPRLFRKSHFSSVKLLFDLVVLEEAAVV